MVHICFKTTVLKNAKKDILLIRVMNVSNALNSAKYAKIQTNVINVCKIIICKILNVKNNVILVELYYAVNGCDQD